VPVDGLDGKGQQAMTLEQSFLAEARAAFMQDGVELPGVRPAAVAGWRRSRAAGAVSSGGPLTQTYEREFSDNSSLLRAARPVISARIQQFRTLDFAMMVVNREGRIVGRWHTTGQMAELLDRQAVQIGALFDEASVGSTALGTPLELGSVAFVEGAEHYNDSFDDVVAAGAPIVNPGTGIIEGVVDIVCPLGIPVEFMLSVVSAAASEIGAQLVNGYAAEDRELLDAFLRSERRGPRRPMVAVNRRVLIANSVSDSIVGAHNHQALWSGARSAISAGHHDLDFVALGDEQLRHGRIQEVVKGSISAGVIVQFSAAAKTFASTSPRTVHESEELLRGLQDSLAGSSRLWNATLTKVARAVVSNERVLLCGRPGAGKSCLATAALQQHFPGCSPAVIDAASPDHLSGAPQAVIIEGLEGLDSESGERLVSWFESLPEPKPYVIGCSTNLVVDANSPEIAGIFDRVVTVPSLASRESDVAVLVRSWATNGGWTVDSAAINELRARPWPGNVRQLFRALDAAAAGSINKLILRDSLPAGIGDGVRSRRFTYLENVEREAIASLMDALGGDKVKVAQELGISRSTLYRKLASLDLDA
jgi:transcriptional regulator of acetoin/glycerol metabolism